MRALVRTNQPAGRCDGMDPVLDAVPELQCAGMPYTAKPPRRYRMLSHPIIRAPNHLLAIGQIGGHVKMGFKHPRGQRTGKTMALVSALPLASDSDRVVLAFMDRSDPTESFDYLPHKGDNAVVIVPKLGLGLSVINGVCPRDWKGVK